MMEFALVHFKQSIETLVTRNKCKASNKPNSGKQQPSESRCVLDKLKYLRLMRRNKRE